MPNTIYSTVSHIIARTTLFTSAVLLSACLGNQPNGTSLIDSANATESTNKPTEIEKLTPRHAFEYKIINSMLKRYHYRKYDLNDDFSGKILDQYIKQLDPSKLYFTKTDIQEFNKHRDKFDDYINAGETEVAVNIFKKYQQRVNERSQYAANRIEQSFNLSKDDSYILDRKDATWMADTKSLNQLWDKRLKNDTSIRFYLIPNMIKPLKNLKNVISALPKERHKLKAMSYFKQLSMHMQVQ
jgi:carboxyl-terminal processing protease